MAVGSVDRPVLMCRGRLGSVEIGNIRGPRNFFFCGLAWPALPALPWAGCSLSWLSICLSVCLYSVQLCFSCVGSSRDLQQRGGPEIVIERAHWVDASSEARTLSASKRDPATCDLRPGWWWGEKHRGAIGGGIDFAQKKPKIGSRSKPNIFLRCWSWAAVSSFEPGITIATVLPIILQRLIFMAWHGIAWHSMA
ncbi:hypothetical protein BGZ57DRAFT_381009 [Hyaloscypha finlandica]|nr:hypothetical protein BGZ57DRAFT_381009 [Hyaloscypha finlandica]